MITLFWRFFVLFLMIEKYSWKEISLFIYFLFETLQHQSYTTSQLYNNLIFLKKNSANKRVSKRDSKLM